MKKNNKHRDYLAFKQLIDIMPGNIYWLNCDGVYFGCNFEHAKHAGLANPSEIVGKRNSDLPWKDDASQIDSINKKIIESGKMETIEETNIAPDGKKEVYLSKKTPIWDEEGIAVGMLGVSYDITDKKDAEELRAKQAIMKVANQVAHDIRAPLASLKMIVKACAEIPERERVALREASNRINDIANNLLNQYRVEQKKEYSKTTKPILLSATLLQLLTEKKFQYDEYPVKFSTEFSDNSHFSFINIDPTAFKRMVSNIINNSVDAFEGNTGEAVLKLDADTDWVFISVHDNGKGMSAALIEKITNNMAVTEGKVDGNGIGLTQVRETLKNHSGSLSIQSTVDKGTEIRLQFPRVQAPAWIAEDITLNHDDLVIILDDDTSIHGAWDSCLESYLVNTNIKVTHFTNGEEALTHIKEIPKSEHQRIILLTDYELLHQSINGLDVVKNSAAKRSILVTSHYENIDIQKRAISLKTKILPKQLVAEVPIKIIEKQNNATSELSTAVAIFVDDDATTLKNLERYLLRDKNVDYYLSPEQLRPELTKYPKKIRIFLDNNFDGSPINGIEFASELHNMGFQNLTIISGERFEPGTLPSFLKIVPKQELDTVISDW